jgi:hypothetical protein
MAKEVIENNLYKFGAGFFHQARRQIGETWNSF